MPYRKLPFVAEGIYHVFSKSIAGYKIFNTDEDFKRIINVLQFYSTENPPRKYSDAIKSSKDFLEVVQREKKIIKLIAYCIMPTHIHLIIVPLKDEILSSYMNRVLKSYSKYFNIKYNRKGPLWEGRFKSVLVQTHEQLIHLTRYIHLNPVTAYLVERPEDWIYSSYNEYIGISETGFCDFKDYLEIQPSMYIQFVQDRVNYQRELAKIKDLIIE
ncbi:MAG: transposase [Endomicrobia bacterium]|nr:transposase [Endomicrobiia bacterium]MDW8056513.1 transposase [Elusimicrobiota bacterium]